LPDSTTALHAHDLGAKVVVLDKASQVGGSRARRAVAGMLEFSE